MIATEVVKALAVGLQHRRNFLLVGPPGVGKTAIMDQVAEKTGHDIITFIAVTSDRTEIGGFPWIYNTENGVKAEKVPIGDLAKLFTATKPTIACFDDIGQAPDSVQASLMQLWWSGKVGGRKISDHVKFLGATNRRQDKAGVTRIIEPFKSRLTIINLETDVNAWDLWASEHNMPIELRAAILADPEMLYFHEPTNEIANSRTPRTIAECGKILQEGYPDELLFEMLAGTAGETFAHYFIGFRDAYMSGQLPKMKEIYEAPDMAKLPERLDLQYLVCLSLAKNATQTNFEATLKYLRRLPTAYSTFAVLEALKLNPAISNTEAFSTWAVDNQEALN